MHHWRSQISPQGKVTFVPTMGALHDGHRSLMGAARKQGDHAVLSIFVNPLQFSPGEDFDRYPRPVEQDLKIAEAEGFDCVYLPTAAHLYPPGHSTRVMESQLTSVLCGPLRPGHFDGVTTIVLKLFHTVRPHRAYFGLKDAQQFFVLEKMVRDLDFPVEMVGCPTLRETNPEWRGLAMSSRNQYLSREEKIRAAAIFETLSITRNKLLQGNPLDPLLTEGKEHLIQRGFQIQYLECRSLPDLREPESQILSAETPYLLAFAGMMGSTRLIDNVLIRPEWLREIQLL